MELFKLLGTIAIENGEAVKALKETSAEGAKAESKLSKAFDKIGGAAVKVGKAVSVGMIAAGTAVVGLSKTAISAYADYEQLVGGVETLFGESANNVILKAEQAFMTAGMSANAYMETVTSFSASLLQSLGGNTAEAAEYADRAIIDMADNANKMGSSIESIQNAYQGFAKGNYAMLDNLKLGYGGTATEMARLINDSGVLGDAMIDLGDKQNIGAALAEVGFAKMTEAIHIVQTEMGITGTTAKEAASTISGSISSMKAAWTDMMTHMADNQYDPEPYINGFVGTVETVIDNVLPRIEDALGGIVFMIQELAPKIIDAIPGIVSKLLPAIIEAGTQIINALVEIIPNIVDTIVDMIPAFIDGVVQIVNALIDALPSIVQAFIDAFPSLIPALVDGLVSMVVTLAENIGQIILPLVEAMPMVISTIIEALMECIPELLVAGGYLLQGLLEGMVAFIVNIPRYIAEVFNAIWNGFCSIFGIHSPSTVMMEIGRYIMEGLFEGIKSLLGNITEIWNNLKELTINAFNGIKDAVLSIGDSIKTGVATVLDNIKNVVSNAIDGVGNAISNGLNIAKDTVSNILGGIKEEFFSIFENVKETVSNAIQKVKDIMNFEWKLPHIKLPHFNISGSFSLNPPSIPRIGVEWYKDGGILTDPTAFGFNPYSGKVMAGGEAGPEAIAPISTLQSYVQEAVSESNYQMYQVMNQMLSLMTQYFPQMANKQLLLDTGALVGELAEPMNEELGKITYMRGRWN